MATTSKQRLALAICDFLSTSVTDGTLPADDQDSIDVAVNCIAESFKVDPTDKAAVAAAIGDQNLLKIYGVYEKLKNATKPADAASASAPAEAPAVSEDAKKEAEKLKGQGNAAMAQKDYPKAIDLYTQALSLHPGNAIFLSNRAAAYSAAKDHESAKADAEAAVTVDPKYTKAWSRLGLARFALGDARGSMEAYQKGIEYEGNGGSDAMKKGFETAKKRTEEIEADEIASRGAGGAAPGGGPNLNDLAGINPDIMNNLMSNPRLRDMASQFGNGGGMPDMSALMSDPNIADMARNLMGG
ncbi:Small glutamine-rich tetratricopeptide repeat-containing protein 2 [Cytospora mali]|uniref:Small glutamine-rich tetratricopeptide repeat-containing protein 2 n=1 Tax=Cytospora mali TaxID=578113 RepID=A0A194UWF7_CYTMA|nr:Small glutamine-rich tetratricopeptide repeat-containing protein 2 [Valsa mali var. pyri (nom. inval.)]